MARKQTKISAAASLLRQKGKTEAAAMLGKKGGSVKSEAKTIACRENAKKGGWPKGRSRIKKKEV